MCFSLFKSGKYTLTSNFCTTGSLKSDQCFLGIIVTGISCVQCLKLFPEAYAGPSNAGAVVDITSEQSSISKDRHGELCFLVSLSFKDLD